MKIVIHTIYSEDWMLELTKGNVTGEVILGEGLKIPFKENLLPEEWEYIKDGLADLASRVQERVLSAIRAAQEETGENL